MSISAQPARRSFQAVAGIVAIAMLTGCSYTFAIPLNEVPRLSATAPPLGEPHRVKTTSGGTETLNTKFNVTVFPRGDMMPYAQPVTFASPLLTEVRGPMIVMQSTTDPRPAWIPVSAVQSIRIRQTSAARTTAVVLGCIVGTALLLAATTIH